MMRGVITLIDVNLIYLTLFQEITGKREERIKVRDDATLKNLLEILSEKYGKKFKEALIDQKSKKIYNYNHVTLNGQLAHLLNKNLEIELKSGDRVVIAQAVSGG